MDTKFLLAIRMAAAGMTAYALTAFSVMQNQQFAQAARNGAAHPLPAFVNRDALE